jgi:5'-nucleotidase
MYAAEMRARTHGKVLGDNAVPMAAEEATSVDVRDDAGGWRPLDPARTYRVVTNSYLASGGDGYAVLASGAPRYDTGFGDAQAFIDYVRQRRRLRPLPSTGVTYLPAK